MSGGSRLLCAWRVKGGSEHGCSLGRSGIGTGASEGVDRPGGALYFLVCVRNDREWERGRGVGVSLLASWWATSQLRFSNFYCCPSALLQLWQREAVGSTHSPGRSVKRSGIDGRDRRGAVWESCVSAVEGAREGVERRCPRSWRQGRRGRIGMRTSSRLWHSVGWRTWRELARRLPGRLLVRHRVRSEVEFGERM